MTFSEYWEKNEPFGSNPEDVAKLAWDAAEAAERERCAKIIDQVQWLSPKIAAQIREGSK